MHKLNMIYKILNSLAPSYSQELACHIYIFTVVKKSYFTQAHKAYRYPTHEMVADIFTKPLPGGQFENLRAILGLIIVQ